MYILEIFTDIRPNGDTHMTTDTDVIYMTNANATGKTYMAGISVS